MNQFCRLAYSYAFLFHLLPLLNSAFAILQVNGWVSSVRLSCRDKYNKRHHYAFQPFEMLCRLPTMTFFRATIVSCLASPFRDDHWQIIYSRFGPSSLHQRDPRSALFEGYDGDAGDRTKRDGSSPGRSSYRAGYSYPGAINGSGNPGLGVERPAYRPATPNSKHVMP